jgi:hypothetical protein
VKRLAAYVAGHRKWITGAALTAAASIAGYAWPQDPWLVTIISTLAVALGVSAVPNREGSSESPERPAGPAPAGSRPGLPQL